MAPVVLILLLSFGSFADAVDLDADIEGNLYVLDAGRDLMIKYSPSGDSLAAVGGFGRGAESFDRPVAVYARRGTDIFVADHNNHRIQRFDRRLDYVTTIRTRDDPDDRIRFGYPLDVAVSRQGEVHVLDGENRRVIVFDHTGRFVRSFGDLSDGEGRMTDPRGLELDDDDNVYLLDAGRIKVYDPFGGWIGHIPTPDDGPVLHFSIERDTMEVVTASALRFYDLRAKRYLQEMSVGVEDAAGPVRRWRERLYIVRKDRIDVCKLPVVEPDTLHDERE